MISRNIQTEVNVNPIIVLLYIQNSHTKIQVKYCYDDVLRAMFTQKNI